MAKLQTDDVQYKNDLPTNDGKGWVLTALNGDARQGTGAYPIWSFFKKYFGSQTPPHTVLFSGRAQSGNITLSQNFTEFDMLAVFFGNDQNDEIQVLYYPVWTFWEGLRTGRHTALASGAKNNYWFIDKGTGYVTLGGHDENSQIVAIWGINFD